MDEKFIAVVFRAVDYRDFDKRVFMVTPMGARQAVMRGVKKPSAKLRFAAMPFAFCEYTAASRTSGGDAFYTITGASQIEDLFAVALDPQKLVAGSLILEAAFSALKSECGEQFVYMLKRLKEIIYEDGDPYIPAVRFLQHIIHSAGYGYDYVLPTGELDTPLSLLSALSFVKSDNTASIVVDKSVMDKTLFKLIDNFERKFEMVFLSKKLI